MNKYDSEFTRDLLPGEVIHWTGIPRQGIYFSPGDLFVVPFSLMWAGFAFFWEWSVYHEWKSAAIEGTKGPGIFFVLWGIPFVVVGIYMVAGRFFYDSYRRARTHYAVTNKRILIKSQGRTELAMTCIEKEKLPEVEVTRKRNGRMTIEFGPNVVYGRSRRMQRPTLEQIEDGDTALKWINEKS